MKSFPHFPERAFYDLSGTWNFCWLGDVPIDQVSPDELHFDEITAVPGVFNLVGKHCEERGVGVYQRKFTISSSRLTNCALDIGALGLRGRVWLDGSPLGQVDIPYIRDRFTFSADSSGEHVLTIAVDSRYDAELTPLFPIFADFYAYGGIYRPVTLMELPATRLERVSVTTLDLSTGKVRLKITIDGDVPDQLDLSIGFDSQPLEKVTAIPTSGVIELERFVPDAKLWTPENPELHTIAVSIEGDTIIERFGLRTIAAKDGRILLNDTPIRLKGVNRHESHPQFGPAQPLQLIIDDLTLIKELGCNFIRAVHYPQCQEFLGLCDQLGLLVWEESLAWGLRDEHLASPRALPQLLEQTSKMVQESINHPSVIFWAFLNECASDTETSEPVYAKLFETIREIDSSRLVCYASNRIERDRCFRYADVACFNLYPGWCGPTSWDGPAIDTIAPFVSKTAELCEREDIKGKPMLVTEIGACAISGMRDRSRAQWTEEFQADYMSEACRTVLSDDRWSGVVLWQFCDTRSFVGTGEVRTKPRGFNYAGLVDEYRRPKLAFDEIKRVFSANPPT